jgi:hypothetical protein
MPFFDKKRKISSKNECEISSFSIRRIYISYYQKEG